MSETLLTTTAAASHAGCDPSHIRRLAGEGKLPGAVHTNPANPPRGEWLIPYGVAEALRKEMAERPHRRGRPKREG